MASALPSPPPLAGRVVLLKSVAQAVPNYSMSCFLLSKITCRKMRAAISNCWWGGSAENRRMHWLRWEWLTQHTSRGGMGFRDLQLFNKSMLGKQGWRLTTRSYSLCARALKGRYFHDTEFLGSSRKKHASHTWRAILAGKEVLCKGMIRRIGDGNMTIYGEIGGFQCISMLNHLHQGMAKWLLWFRTY
jgi:hypothetical protein